ncbi:class I SAM-dependent DNA methyltransferase [Sphingomonas sp. CJ99]
MSGSGEGATAMDEDLSEGWEAVAGQFMAIRSDIGAALVRGWARERLMPGATILDLGCGSGVPIGEALLADGFALHGVDASPTMIRSFQTRHPDVPLACEAAQTSVMFGGPFDAVIAIGLIFLLAEEDQRAVLTRSAAVLRPGGWLLFSAPDRPCVWDDRLTGRQSRSLGADAYAAHLARTGINVISWRLDEGGNGYCEAQRPLR